MFIHCAYYICLYCILPYLQSANNDWIWKLFMFLFFHSYSEINDSKLTSSCMFLFVTSDLQKKNPASQSILLYNGNQDTKLESDPKGKWYFPPTFASALLKYTRYTKMMTKEWINGNTGHNDIFSTQIVLLLPLL